MKYILKVAWYILITAIALAIFVLVSAKVFAHGQDECLTDADGKVKLDNGGWVKIIGHLRGTDLDDSHGHRFAHGHRDQYYDKHGNPTGQAKGFFDIDFDGVETDYFADCPTTPPSPRQSTPQRRSPVKAHAPKPSQVSLQAADEQEEIVEVVVMSEYFLYGNWYEGKNLVSLPVVKESWKTIADFYDHYNQGNYSSFMGGSTIYFHDVGDEWYSYNGQDGQNLAGDVPLTPYLGFIVERDYTTWWGLWGVRLMGDGEVDISPGINVLGLTELTSRYERPSDFLEIEGIESVQVTKWSSEERKSVLLTIEQSGDEGDDLLHLGQAVILNSRVQTTLDMTEQAPGAPQALRYRTLTTAWGAMKR